LFRGLKRCSENSRGFQRTGGVFRGLKIKGNDWDVQENEGMFRKLKGCSGN